MIPITPERIAPSLVTAQRKPPQSGEPERARLLERAKTGDTEAVRELLCTHEHALRGYVRVHVDAALRAQESCTDMVQSVFRECLQELPGFEFRHEHGFRKWLFQKALAKIVDRRRYWLAAKRQPGAGTGSTTPVDALPAPAASVSSIAILGEDLQALEGCFAELPEDYQRVIAAARLLGQPHADIAAEMNRSVEAVGMLLNRALARLARLMHARKWR